MPLMRFPARPLLAGLVLALCAGTAMPQATSLYTVEIVVFRGTGDGGALPATDVPPAFTDDNIEATPAAPVRLDSAARKLDDSADFTVLAHTAWTQGPTVWNSGLGVSARQLALGNGVEGKFSLERSGSYPLNLRVDLTVEEGGRRYRIREVRRNVKVDQIQYLDHPAIGVLAIVTRAKD
jgi:hypothetical protein